MSAPTHLLNFRRNLLQVSRLMQIHARLTGTARGRRRNVDALNAAGIVLAVACWEAFVEDVAGASFDLLLDNAKRPADAPKEMVKLVATRFRKDKNESRIWELAGKGWRAVLGSYRDEIIAGFSNP